MKKMAIRWESYFFLFVFVFFGFCQIDVHAAGKNVSSQVKKIAYIDSENNLILRFNDFSKKGYSYEVEGNGGSFSGSAGLLSELRIDNKLYAAGKTYTLKLTASDSGDFINVYYSTGSRKMTSAAVSNSGNTIKSSKWKFKDAGQNGGYWLAVAEKSGSLDKMVSKKGSDSNASNMTVSGSSLLPGKYAAYTIGIVNSGNAAYYGYGVCSTLSFLPKPNKVSGLKVQAQNKKAALSWTNVRGATGYEIYCKKPGSSKFVLLGKSSSASYVAKKLAEEKKYSFKVRAYTKLDRKTAYGTYSAVKGCTIPKVPGIVKGVAFDVDYHGKLLVTWNKTKNANAYDVYYKLKSGKKYELLGSTKTTSYNISKLNAGKTYSFYVTARKNYAVSAKHSKVISVKPSAFLKKNKQRLLAMKVKTIQYKNGKCITTKKLYTKEVNEAYVNYKGFSSPSKYLIFASPRTQRVAIFKGSKGKWKQIKFCICASGSYNGRTKRGTHKITFKERRWNQGRGKEILYVSHFYKKSSFHTRTLYNGTNRPVVATLGKPVSHACIRLKNEDAYFIYKKIPVGTTVRIT